MYQKIEEGKHIKKANSSETETAAKAPSKTRKVKTARIQQLNVEVKSNEHQFRKHYFN